MAKFVIECPECGRYTEASTGIFGLFGTKKIDCMCGRTINVKTEKMKTKTCAHCGNLVVFDQSKGEAAICPVCHESINTRDSLHTLINFDCPTCNCGLSADKNAEKYTCPLCDTVIDVQEQVKKEEVRKKGLASVIKYEGNADTLIWKHPIEDFNWGSQLIVHESQEAIFFRDGQALDLFGAGRHTLETAQLPVMEKFYVLPTDAERTFHAEVYYINKANHMGFKWGTPEKVIFMEPTSQAPISIGARGTFNFKVSDSRKMLLKLVGTTNGVTRDDVFSGDSETNMKTYFRKVVQIGVSSKLAEIITSEKLDILQIDQQKLVLSEKLKEALLPYFDDYGMEITEFLLEGIILPQKDEIGYDVLQTLISLRQATLKKQVISTDADIKKAELDAQKDVDVRSHINRVEIEQARAQSVAAKGEVDVLETQYAGQKELAKAQAQIQAERLRMQLEMDRKAMEGHIEAQVMAEKGYTGKDELQAGIMKAFAENQSGGAGMGAMAGQALGMGANFATMGAAMGMASNMMGVGAQMGKEMSGAMTGALNNTAVMPATGWTCACGKTGITSKFCPECGAKKPEESVNLGWTCACGKTGITSKFCPECGAKKPEEDLGWTCACGKTGITSKFCPECGSPRQ